ncbi:MAG: HEAT repeat domain-containing protein [Methanomicrobiales archaeon]
MSKNHSITLINVENMKWDKDLEGLTLALQSENRYIRKEAAFALRFIPGKNSANSLLTVLNDPFWAVRAVTIQSLSYICDEKVIPYLIDYLNDDCWVVRCSAIEALVKLGECDVIDHIIPYLLDEDPHVREITEKAVDKLNNKKIVNKEEIHKYK